MERVKHKGTPAEPYATPGMYGVVTRTDNDRPRITPAYRGSPALAHIAWGEGSDTFHTWERIADLIPLGKPRKDKPE